MKLILIITLICSFLGCNLSQQENKSQDPYIIVLGIAQDAGYPQINCNKKCCKNTWEDNSLRKFTSCLALVDPLTKEQWLFDATPDIKDQLWLLKTMTKINQITGVFLTHAHMGHYSGLMHFGREAMGAKKIPVFTMPRMKKYLTTNGPWSQLIELQNINLTALKDSSEISINKRIKITPFLVPHRDEFSETVGYKIKTKNKSMIFIPDIDKWQKWSQDICSIIEEVDYAFLDGTFYRNGELKRDMSEIPHPFVEESMRLFQDLSISDKKKVYFIHFNHTNPLLIPESKSKKEVIKKGFNIASQAEIILL